LERKECEKLYWFSTNEEKAKTHADYWKDSNGDKFKLTLKCKIWYIPENIENGDCIFGVDSNEIEILEYIWN
jgi:hypothetical protein